MVSRLQPVAKILFLVFFILTYAIKPLISFLYSNSDYDFYTFQGLSSESHIFATFSVLIFYFIFLFGYSINIKSSLCQKHAVSVNNKRKDFTIYAVLLMSLLFLWQYQAGTSAYLVILLGSTHILIIYNILLGGFRAWLSIAVTILIAQNMMGSKGIILFSLACLCLFLYKKALTLNYSRHQYRLMVILIIFLVPIVGVLQVLRWNQGDFSILNAELISVGFSTTFDGYDTLRAYYDNLDKAPIFTWLSEFWLLIPRGLIEDKPLIYGLNLISDYFYPGEFFINNIDGSGGGQFPPGIIVLAIDFLWFPGLFVYPLLIGLLLKSIDNSFTYGGNFQKAIAIYFILQINTLVRSGLVSYVIYSVVFLIGAYFIYQIVNRVFSLSRFNPS